MKKKNITVSYYVVLWGNSGQDFDDMNDFKTYEEAYGFGTKETKKDDWDSFEIFVFIPEELTNSESYEEYRIYTSKKGAK